jgi:hypothetical protein
MQNPKEIPMVQQIGENKKYPQKALVWEYGMKVPEWLSDQAKVKFIDGEGNITLETQMSNIGSIGILDCSGKKTLVTLKDSGSVLIYEKSYGIMSLTKRQLNLLYEKI